MRRPCAMRKMDNFPGFTSSETFTQIPDSFIHLLKEIDDMRRS